MIEIAILEIAILEIAMRLFYAAGPGDAIGAHKHWIAGNNDPGQMALTYSGQFADFCHDIGAEALIVSSSNAAGVFQLGRFRVEHVPKNKFLTAKAWHLSQILYGLKMIVLAWRFGAQVAVIHSDTTYPFVASLFCCFGIKPIAVLHNTLWPTGFPPSRTIDRMLMKINGIFFRHFASATIGVSPECIRQVQTLGGNKLRNAALIDMRGQFSKEYFADMTPPVRGSQFRILYASRMVENKGCFDVLAMALEVERRLPGIVKWEVCGAGSGLSTMEDFVKKNDLGAVITIHGHVLPLEMKSILISCHAAIVPTRSTFAEGMALAAVEPVLAGRPVITCSVVPALEALRPACVEAVTDDILSYVEHIVRLVSESDQYAELCSACELVSEQFYDRRRGFAAALRKAIT